jgi:sulfur carrier protein
LARSYGERRAEIVTNAVAGEVVLAVNGAERRIPKGWTVADLLASLELDARTVVIERNGTILRDRSSFASVGLVPDDSIEIVHFVGGG